MGSRIVGKSKSRTAFEIINYFVLSLLGIFTLAPFIYIFIVSFIPKEQYERLGVSFPQHISFANYAVFLNAGSIIKDAYISTIFITAMGTLIGVLATAGLAYALSRKGLPGRSIINYGVFFTMIFSGGLIPKYLVVKGLGLYDTLWSITLCSCVYSMLVFIMRTFFQQIPESLQESAFIDGADEFTIMIRIIFPLSLPVFATVALFYAVDRWNEWFEASFFLSNSKLFPLQLSLRNIINFNQSISDPRNIRVDMPQPPGDIIKMAAIIIAILPIVCIYPFVQKYFVKGVMMGSIKG